MSIMDVMLLYMTRLRWLKNHSYKVLYYNLVSVLSILLCGMNKIIKKIEGYVNVSSETNDTWMQRDKTLKVCKATGKGQFHGMFSK